MSLLSPEAQDLISLAPSSFNMSRIRNRDTRPEMIVRSIVHSLGYRYCLHKKDLPGKPDIVLVLRALKREGWKVMIVWECETKNLASLQTKLQRFLDS